MAAGRPGDVEVNVQLQLALELRLHGGLQVEGIDPRRRCQGSGDGDMEMGRAIGITKSSGSKNANALRDQKKITTMRTERRSSNCCNKKLCNRNHSDPI